MNTCPKRHRTECKNGSTCLFRKSNSCEFLHSEAWEEEVRNSEVETLQMMNDGQGAGLSYLKENIQTLEKITKQSAKNFEALEAKFSQKIEFLESKVAELERKLRNDEKGDCNDDKTERVETTTKKICNIFNCDICNKEFKSKSNLQNHDKKYHMVKGRNIYKCDNCNEKLDDKLKLKYHITKEHIACTICLKIFPTITSLNIHITAVHDQLITKHQIEKEPSYRQKKVQKS